jgi:hypothetical protein
MADPFSMAAMSLVGGVTKAQGSIDQAQQQAQMLQLQQQIAERNAANQYMQAASVASETNAGAMLQERRARAVISKQKAKQAQNNYFGESAEAILDQSAANAELDRLNLIYGGESQVQGIKAQARNSQYQADMYKSQIQPTLDAGYVNAGGQLLSSFGQASFLGNQQSVDPYMSWGKM